MSDEQPDEEPTGLSALLNRHVPANPGKPRPWTPSEPARYGTEGQGTEPDPSEGDDPAARGFGEARPSEPPRQQPAAPTATAGAASAVGAVGAPAPPAWPEGTGDLSAVLADVGRLTSSMQGRLAELHGAIESAKDQTYEATAADESVVVEVNGRPRVTRVSVDAKALRGGPEALGAWVVEAVNAATSKARAGAQTALLDGLDPEMRAAVAAGIAEATGDGTSEGKGGRP
ncbi:MAG TPA: YbaB/EbfC family nucleoid-associated protein [Streptosporangiaceae bacterium]